MEYVNYNFAIREVYGTQIVSLPSDIELLRAAGMVRLLQNTMMVSVVHFAKVWAKDYLLLSCPYLSLPSEGIIPACLGLG
jgi:hypothetical protein